MVGGGLILVLLRAKVWKRSSQKITLVQEGHLDKFKEIMSDLLNDAMDHFQVLELAKAFLVSSFQT